MSWADSATFLQDASRGLQSSMGFQDFDFDRTKETLRATQGCSGLLSNFFIKFQLKIYGFGVLEGKYYMEIALE